jgi:hypothetical protein
VQIVELDGPAWDAAAPGRCDVLVIHAGAWRGESPGDGVRALRAREPRATLIVHGAGGDGALRARLLESGADLVFATTAEFHAIREVLGELLRDRHASRIASRGAPCSGGERSAPAAACERETPVRRAGGSRRAPPACGRAGAEAMMARAPLPPARRPHAR